MEGQIKKTVIEKRNPKQMSGVFTHTDNASILAGFKKCFSERLSDSQIQNLYNYFEAKPERYSFASLHFRFADGKLIMLCEVETDKKDRRGKMEFAERMEEVDITTL